MIFQQIFSRSHNRNGKHTPDNEQDIAHGVCHRVAYRRDIAPDGILHGAERCGAGAGAGAAAECYGWVETEYLMAEPQSEKQRNSRADSAGYEECGAYIDQTLHEC